MSADRTLLMIKPDAVAKNAIGDILQRLEAEGFVIRQMRMNHLSQEQAQGFYEVHKERPFFGELVSFMTSGQSVQVALQRENAVAHLRNFIGETDSTKAAAGTIRAVFGTDIQCNAVHASDSDDNAANEIAFYFGD